jgi:hypothetical protein
MIATARVRGMNIGRSLRKAYTEASEPSWEETGRTFHHQMRPARFTHKHAREAGYMKRKPGYEKRKFRRFGHTYPLVWSGEVKRLVATARIKARKGTGQAGNQGGVQVIYPGARKLNLRSKHTNIRMNEEFTRVTDREAGLLGLYFETRFSMRFSQRG